MYVRRCMIVTAANQVLAQTIAKGLAPPPSADQMWFTPLSPTGALPATHYITEGPMLQQFADLMADANAMYTQVSAAHVTYQGSPITLAQCQDLLGTGDVGTDDSFTALARLGLQMIPAAS